MKSQVSKGVAIVCSLVLSAFSLSSPFLKAAAAPVNLIANPSVETANSAGTAPLNWQTDHWGTGTASFQYKTTGFNSSRSVYVSVSGYNSGDSKWFFNPVTVSPNTTYTFSETYQSNIKTHIVAESLTSAGAESYWDVDTAVPVSNGTWKTVTYSVKTKANTAKLTLLHLVEANGWLQTDNFSLTAPDTGTPTPPTPPTPPVTNGLVPNPSVEQSANSLPTNWEQSGWGTNSPSYQYVTGDGHDGTHSVKVTMANYTDGDAKWVYTPQALTHGADYRFTAWYKTNTIPHVVAWYTHADGTEDFFGLPDPEPAANAGTTWQKYSSVFSVPANATGVSLFFFLSNDGWVQTDDYSIAPYQYVGFDHARVTLTFDNGFEDNITNAIPVMDKYGIKATYCYSTEYVEGQPDQEAIVKRIAADGYETCSHSVHHEDLTLLDIPTLDYELSHSKDYLQQLTGANVTDFLTPFGAYNTTVNNEIKKYYTAHRTTDEGFNSKDNLDQYRLRVQNMAPDTTTAQFEAWVNKAKADHTWLIIVYHAVHNTNLDTFDTKIKDFQDQMKWLSTAGVSIEMMNQAVAETSAQAN